jgi:Family of unknown function (DUF6111)
MRWAEAAMFLAPFALYVAWRVAAVQARPSIVWTTAAAVLALAAVTVWLGLTRRLDRSERYVPAHVEDGRIVPGHGVRRPGT